MYRFTREKGKDERNKEMVGGQGTGLNMGGKNKLGSIERRVEGPHTIVEMDVR